MLRGNGWSRLVVVVAIVGGIAMATGCNQQQLQERNVALQKQLEQAMGQNAAINQQLASNSITNVVSAARIQELPDANAAESVGAFSHQQHQRAASTVAAKVDAAGIDEPLAA